MGVCELCGIETDHLLELVRNNDESQMLCPSCWGYEDERGDLEYERQKEEQDPNSDHERDIKQRRNT